MLSTPSSPFREAYQAEIASGAIEPDAAQAEVAEAYAALDQRLATYKPQRKQGLLARLFGGNDKDEAPRGLYIHGEVGRGKTMLMDLFFQHSSVEHKRRAHFHEFMAEAHERIYDYRQSIARGEIADGDVIALTANAMVGHREEYLASGMDDYVSQPIRMRELAGALARVAGQPMAAGAAPDGPPPEPDDGDAGLGDLLGRIAALNAAAEG